jgi:acetylornithine deacetylase/succinyl-diaminopimelate desuccinylase-like protein
LRPLLFLLAAAALAPAQNIDWAKVQAESLRYWTDLIRIDTSSPPANETKAAKYLQAILEKEGIEVKLFGPTPDRMSLIARIKGNGSKKPIAVYGHLDVVGVQRDRWSEDPFGGKVIDGFVWGRGSIDDKDNVVASLMTILLLKRSGVALDRDVIFVAEADEEAGGKEGILFLVDKHWSDIEAEYCLAEGGGFVSKNGKLTHQNIQLAEKKVQTMRLVTSGTAGHGSQPRPDNAIVRLSNAVAKIAAWQPPMRLNDITRAYFEKLALISTPEEAARFNGVTNPAKTAAIQEYFRQNDIFHNSILRTTISPNIIQGGFRSNVIPSEASATLDIRALPDEDMEKFKAEMAKVINDPLVKIEPFGTQNLPAPAGSMNTELYRVLESVQKRMFPGTITLPLMQTGGTDMGALRRKGVACYGVGIERPAEDAISHAAHSDNERGKISGLYDFVRYQFEVVAEMAKKK